MCGIKEPEHLPVLLNRFLELALPGTLWDGTLGLAGHSKAWLNKYPQGQLFGSDQDAAMLSLAREKLLGPGLAGRVNIKPGNFSSLPFSEQRFDNILLDLGISSLHFDAFKRGFSYRFEQSLDMRMNTEEGIPLFEWLEQADEKEITEVLFRFGEEPRARQIASLIIERRTQSPVKNTKDLVSICEQVYSRVPQRFKHTSRHPYVRAFQAFRIYINDELGHLERALELIPDRLNPGGRLFIISFHSLEDRLVKKKFQALEIVETPQDPFSSSRPGEFKRVLKKPVTASSEEMKENSRSRSARMRILEKTIS